MHVVVTGGSGFLGTRLVARLCRDRQMYAFGDMRPIERVVIVDRRPPPRSGDDALVEWIEGDVRDRDCVPEASTRADRLVVFHLASALSGDCQRDRDLAYATNVEPLLHLLAAVRSLGPKRCCIVSASSVAAAVSVAAGAAVPSSTYGITKRISEALLANGHARGDARCVSVRLPTVIVRDLEHSGAASAFLSCAAHNALHGRTAALPVAAEHPMLVTSPRVVVEALMRAALGGASTETPGRVLAAPGVTASARQIVDIVAQLARSTHEPRCVVREDPVTAQIIRSWPAAWGACTDQQVLDVPVPPLAEMLATWASVADGR